MGGGEGEEDTFVQPGWTSPLRVLGSAATKGPMLEEKKQRREVKTRQTTMLPRGPDMALSLPIGRLSHKSRQSAPRSCGCRSPRERRFDPSSQSSGIR